MTFLLIGRGPTGLNNNSQKIVSCFVDFVNDLQDKISLHVPNMSIYSSIIQNDVLYYSTECCHKEVMINW
jgi:hypothetical protein